MTKSYTLGKHFEDFITNQLENGRYNNASEVIRSGLRLLEDREKSQEIKLLQLKLALKEGLDDVKKGKTQNSDQLFKELKAKYTTKKTKNDKKK